MADTKISALTAYTTPLVADVLPIVDTAGGETKKITWANLFKSPTLITPDLGTPSAGVLTNASGTATNLIAGKAVILNTARTINGTSFDGSANITITAAGSTLSDTVTVAKGGTGATTFTDGGVLIGNTTGAVQATSAGTAGQVLTSNGAGVDPTFQTFSGSPTMKRSTSFETFTRFTQTLVSGSATFGAQGLVLATSATATRSASVTWGIINSAGSLNSAIFLGSPVFSASVYVTDPTIASGTGSLYTGLGAVTVSGSGHTFTTKHIGFKILKTGGVISLYATQGDGSTETASSALTTLARFDTLDLIVKVNSTTSVDYYWRKNGGPLSSATNLSTNMPTDVDASDAQFSVSNEGTTFEYSFIFGGASYER